MNIVRWNPLGEMVSLRDAMDRLFEDSFVGPLSAASNGQLLAVPVDIYATENEVVVKAALPGVKPEEVSVTIEADCLTIQGETKAEHETKTGTYLRQEHRYGAFCRQIMLPSEVNADAASAAYENGVLKITLPKAEVAKPKQIKVQTATQK